MTQKLPRRRIGDIDKPVLGQLMEVVEGATVPTARDLTGITSVKFTMINQATGVTKVNAATATVDDATTGKVSYALVAADVDTAGQFTAFFTVFTATVSGTFPVKALDLIMLIDSDTQSAEDVYAAALIA